jgi:hypothetical protein
MRWKEIFETVTEDGLMDMWGLMQHYDLVDFRDKFDDATLPWLNRNARWPIDRFVKNKKARLLSMLRLWTYVTGVKNAWNTPFATPADFEAALTIPVTLWRGGGGVYDPNYAPPSPWISFTAKKGRVDTFSQYDGTYSQKGYHVLPKRKQYWVVELTIPLNQILLYLPNGYDEEVIIGTDLAKQAKLISTEAVNA